MKPIETPSNKTIPEHLKMRRVLDNRKNKIRGLWVRNGRYYAQLTLRDPVTGIKSTPKTPLLIKNEAGELLPVQTVAEAVKAIARLKTERDDNTLPPLKRTPKFNDYALAYLANPTTLNKRKNTVETETTHLNHWIRLLNDIRLNQITKQMITTCRDKMQTEPSLHTGRKNQPRTINLAMTCLRNVLTKAIDDGHLQRSPADGIKPLIVTTRKKQLVPMDSIKKICDSGMQYKNGQQFKDLILFLSYSGGRISESLRLTWKDVDWQEKHITIGSDGLAKNYLSRIVNFNDNLETHLKDMLSRKASDTDYIFPSPQRGKADKVAKTFRETLKLARDKAGFPKFGFHDCRHFFASMCAMSDVPKDTVRTWMGHSDTKLLDEVYLHYASDYHAKQAAKVRFEPVIMDSNVA